MTFKTENAMIKSASIRIERDFILDCTLHLEFCNGGQSFGGWMLSHADRVENDPAGPYLCAIMQTVGVDDWASLPGKVVRAKSEDGRLVAIGHAVKDKWFYPEAMFAALKGAAE